jgi:tape measure domain-containing protein
MAKLYFKVSSDYQEVIRLRNEIAKLETQIKSMDVNKAPQAVAVLNNQMQQAKQQMRGMVEEAAVAGAVMGNDLKQKIYQGSQAVNDFTQKIINQKTVVKDIEADVRRLSDAYKKVRNNPLQANSALGELNAAKKALQEEKSTLFGLQTEQSNARLSVKKLRDEYSLYKDDTKNVVNANGGMSMSFGKMLGVIGGVAALKQLGSELIHVKGQFESIEIALDTMLGSKEKTDALLAEVKNYATVSPLTLTDISSATQMMLGFNIEAEKVPTYFKAIGDISMGDTQKFNSLTLAFSQMSATGKLMGQDLNQMINAGFNPLQVIAQKTGKSIAELKDEMSKGAVSSEMVQQAFIDATSAGGKFYKMSENASKTINGQLSMMQDALDRVFNEIGTDGEGAIMGVIKGTTSLIQNYETVGKVLTGLIATYGAYRVALALTVLEDGKYVISLARLGTVLKSSAVAQSLLNSAILKNPYVAAAVLIGTLVTAIWAFHDATTAQEKELKRISEGTEQYNQYLEDEKNRIDELIAKLQDETLTREDKLEAFKELQKIAPKIFGEYKTEQNLIDHLTEARKKENEQILIRQKLMGSYNMNQNAERLKELKRLQELQKVGGAGRVRQGTQAEYESLYAQFNIKQDKGWLDTDAEVIKGKIKALISSIGNAQKDMRVSQQNTWELTLDAMSKSTAKAQKTMYEGYRIILRDSGKQWIKIQGEEAPIDQETITNRITLLDQKVLSVEEKNASQFRNEAKKAWEKAKKEVESVKTSSTSYKSAAQYEKALKEAQDKEETSEKAYKDLGGQTGSSLSKEESTKEKLRKETDKYNVLLSKQALEEQRTAEDLQMKTDEAHIKSLDDGSKKTIEQMELNFEKEMQAIDRQKEDLLRKKIDNARSTFESNPQNKGKSFDASGISLSDAEIKDFNEQYKAAIAEYGKEVDKQNATGIQVMNDYLKEYGTFQQKKLAIAQEYDEKIAKSTDEWQKKSLEEQKTSAIGKVDIESIKADIDWVSVFSEFGGMFKSITEPILEKAKEYTKTKDFKQSGATDQKTLVDAINKMEESMGVGGSLNFKKLGTDMAAYQLAINSLKNAKIEEYESIERLKKAQEDYAKALKDGSDQEKKTAKDALDLAQQNANASSTNVKSQEEVANSAQQIVTNTATNLKKSMDSTIEGLSQLSSGGLKDVYDGLIKIGNGMGGVMGNIANKLNDAPIIGWIASIVDVLKDGLSNFFGSILDSIGDAIVNGTKDVFSGDVFKTIVKSVTSSSSEMINLMSLGLNNKILGFLGVGGNAKEVNELVDRLTNSNKYLINAIDKLTTEMEKSGGKSATELYTDAYQKKIQKIDNDRQMLEAKMGYHGAHHSNDYYINDAFNASDWEKASDYVGKKLSSAGDLWKLSSEDLSKLQELPDIWEKINSGKYDQSEWLDAYIDDADALAELTEQWQETMAQTSFDDFYSSFLDTLSDMNSDTEDFADDFESYLQKSILNAMLADNFKSRIQALYDSWTDAYKDDNKITPDEAEELKKQQQNITDDMIAQRQSLIDAFGWDTSSSSSQSSTSGGYETISQDTGEEVSGRLAAVQITGEELKAQSVLQSQSLNMLTVKAEEYLTVSKDSKDIADETRTILANTYLETVEIRENTGMAAKYLKDIKADIAEVKTNTKAMAG